MNATAHPAPETLLLFALGRDISTPDGPSDAEATRALLAHAEACPRCADALDAALSLAASEALVEDRLSARDAILSPTAASRAALLAAAADARAFEAPPALSLAGTARLPSGEEASIFRRPGAPPTFALDRRELFGRAVRLSSPDGALAARVEVDRFGRLRLDAALPALLERLLAGREGLTIAPA